MTSASPDDQRHRWPGLAEVVGDPPPPEEQSHRWTERDRVARAAGVVVTQLGLAAGDAPARWAHDCTAR